MRLHSHPIISGAFGAACIVFSSAGCGASHTNDEVRTPETTSGNIQRAPAESPLPQPNQPMNSEATGGGAGSTTTMGPANGGDPPNLAGQSSMSGPSMLGQPSGPTVNDATSLNDGTIAEIVSDANSGEIEQGRYAAQHATNARVKRFAQHMVTAHSDLGQKMSTLLKNQTITPTASEQSTKLSAGARQTMESLQSKTGADFDSAYIDAQVKGHQDLLDMLDQKLIANAQNAEFKATLQKLRPTVAAHLKDAQDIQKALGAQ
jgi:putative membrane protein